MKSLCAIFIKSTLVVTFLVAGFLNSAEAGSIRCEEVFEQKPSWFYVANKEDYFAPDSPRMGRDVSVKELMDENGDIWLFRVNGGRHINGKTGFYTETEAGKLSTSLNPEIAFTWFPKSGTAEKITEPTYVLIVKQNIYKDNLSYPINEKKYPGQGFVVNQWGRREKILTEETRMEEIAFFEEVKVAPDQFNLVAEIPLEDFKAILSKEFYPRSFHPRDLAKVLAERYRTKPQ